MRAPRLAARALALAALLPAAAAAAPRGRLFRREAAAAGARRSWLEEGEARALQQDLTICTLVDGRGKGLSSDIEVEIPHLLETAQDWDAAPAAAAGPAALQPGRPQGATHAVVLVDCEGVGGRQVLRRVDALQAKIQHRLPFEYRCVNTSDAARTEWTKMWLEAPDQAGAWPVDYISTLRLGLHQCLWTECRTKYCAWSDSDIVMVPHFAAGWARGLLDCLLGAASSTAPEDQPVFTVMQGMQSTMPKMPGRDAEDWNFMYMEFSSQAFLVDRNRLFDKWLPIERAIVNYTDLTRFKKYSIGLREHPLESAIERLVVAKATSEYDRCESESRYCAPVVTCNPEPAWKVLYEEYASSVKDAGLNSGAFVASFTEAYRKLRNHRRLDLYTSELQSLLKRFGRQERSL